MPSTADAIIIGGGVMGLCCAARLNELGVGRIVLTLDNPIPAEQLELQVTTVSDAEGRILYPSIRYTEPLGLLRDLLDLPQQAAASELHFHFLFRGDRPLDVHINQPRPQTIQPW